MDNGSTDGSAEWVRQNFHEFRLVQLNDNRGFAGGNNAGIMQARGEWIALINNDATAEPDWLEQLYGAVEGNERVGLAASRVVLTSGALDSAGDGMTIAGVPYKRGHGSSPTGVFLKPAEVFGASGCGVLLRRSMLDKIGLLMRQSHESLRDDYEVSSKELDLMAEAAWAAQGCVGARMTGAGFGGACVALVENSTLPRFIEQVSKRYLETSGIPGEIMPCKLSDGAHAMSGVHTSG